MKRKIFFASSMAFIIATVFVLPRYTKYHLPVIIWQKPKEKETEYARIKLKAAELKKYCLANDYSTHFGFIADMKQHSGLKRFFVYDFAKDSVVASGLVAHGSCNSAYLKTAKFSNNVGCGCSAKGKYKIGYTYKGRFGKAFKLYGLEKSNNNAFGRNIVLHAYDCVPDEATYPQPICNSLGCAMVSYRFLETLSGYIGKTEEEIVLWVIE